MLSVQTVLESRVQHARSKSQYGNKNLQVLTPSEVIGGLKWMKPFLIPERGRPLPSQRLDQFLDSMNTIAFLASQVDVDKVDR
jgi:hypothetical protein